MNLWQRVRQDGRNSCENTVVEQTWLGGSVRNSNFIGEIAATVAAKNRLTGPGGSGGREAAEMSIQEQQRRRKLGLTATAGRRQGDRKTLETVTEAEQIWICGRSCGKTEATDVTTRWWSKLGLAVASATEMAEARRQQQWRQKLDLQELTALESERRQKPQDNNNGGRENLFLEETAGRRQGDSKRIVAQIWICGRCCGKTSETAVTTRWRI